MPLIAEATGKCEHSGSILGGRVQGTLEVITQEFVTVINSAVMVEDDYMVVPLHAFSLLPPFFHSHKYKAAPKQDFVTIEGKLINMFGDAYESDMTEISYAGDYNDFVFINEAMGPIPPTELWPAPWNEPNYIPWINYW